MGNKAKHRVAISDDPFLLLDRELVPPIQVMKVLLHDHITSAGEPRVLLADDGRVASWLIDGIFGPVDEADQIAIIEIFEAVDFVRCGYSVTES